MLTITKEIANIKWNTKDSKRPKRDWRSGTTPSVTVQLSNAPLPRPAASEHLRKIKENGMSIKIILSKPPTCRLSSHLNLAAFPRFPTSVLGHLVLILVPWDLPLGFHRFVVLSLNLEVPYAKLIWSVSLYEALPLHSYLGLHGI